MARKPWVAALVVALVPQHAQAAVVELVDHASVAALLPNNGDTFIPSTNLDGSQWVFSSTATTLLPADRNRTEDVYVYDRNTLQTRLVSASPTGTPGNRYSSGASMSADGEVVVFYSLANNLVGGDTNNVEDVFIWTRATGSLQRIVSAAGTQLNNHSYFPRITPDGRYITFTSMALNILPGEDTTADVFRYDRTTGAIVRVSERQDGVNGNAESSRSDISADGNIVLFSSLSQNFVAADSNPQRDMYLKNLTTGALTLVSKNTSGQSPGVAVESNTWGQRLSADGNTAVFAVRASLTPGSNTVGQAYAYSAATDSVTLLSSGYHGSVERPVHRRAGFALGVPFHVHVC